MLVELRIRDFAVIRDLSVEMGPGLNTLTGETGAGKSILIGALSLLLGERASSESVRTGADRAVVEAVFDVSRLPGLTARLDELGLPSSDDFLLLRREVQAQGRNRAWINGSPATAGVVGEFGTALVDLHGQHEHQTLLSTDHQRAILDAFAEALLAAGAVAEHHDEVRRLEGELHAREERRRELEGRSDFLRFQLGEIDQARLSPGEDEEIDAELRRLDHAEELARDADAAHHLLYAGEGAASEQLSQALRLLQRLARVDPDLEGLAGEVETAYHQATEAGRSLADYASGVEVNPARAEELRQRQDLLFRLKRKYGPELADVLATGERLRGELDELEVGAVELDEVESRLSEARNRLTAAAEELSRLRRDGAEELAGRVGTLLPELGFSEAVFKVALEPLEAPGPDGAERVRFLASLNPGFEPRPLASIASGGELSRVMLALKSVLASVDRVPTLIFDEIDAGIGGTVANAVAEKLAQVARQHQVLVITHLPQLASRGRRHLRVEKGTQDGIAATTVLTLDGEDRVREIARMLGGDPESRTSREHARELLAEAG
jgi:DNA repair protein RecN (Recombination protein N)